MPIKAKPAVLAVGDGINFYDGGRKTAHLNSAGRLCIFDEGGNPTFWESWRDYVKTEMGDKPASDDDVDAITKQLSMALGAAEAVTVDIPNTKTVKTSKEEKETMPETETTATPVKTKKAAKAKPEPKAKKASGKKYEVPNVSAMFNLAKDAKSVFTIGGDAKFKGLLKRVAEGEVAESNVPKVAFEKFAEIGFLTSGAFPHYTNLMKKLAKDRGISLASK